MKRKVVESGPVDPGDPRDGGNPERDTFVVYVRAKAEVEQVVYAQPGSKYAGELHLGLLQTDIQLAVATQPATSEERALATRAGREILARR